MTWKQTLSKRVVRIACGLALLMQLPPAAIAQFQAADWSVRTLPVNVRRGDNNVDGIVNSVDLEVWGEQYGKTLGGMALLHWQRNINALHVQDVASRVSGLSSGGFRYRAQNGDKHVVAQKLSDPGDYALTADGDRVRLSFEITVNVATDAAGTGEGALRYALFDSTQDSLFVNRLGVDGGGGGDGFSFLNYNKVSSDPTFPDPGGPEQTMGFSTFIGSDVGYSGQGGALGGRPMRPDVGGQLNDDFHILGGLEGDIHELEIAVTRLNQGIYLLETNHTNIAEASNFSRRVNERLFSNLWRDPINDLLSFDGFSMTVQNQGEHDVPFDFTINNLTMTKESTGTVGVDPGGRFHLDFVGRQKFDSFDDCNHCWIEQDAKGGVEDFTWAPFILQTDGFDRLNEPQLGFINPSMSYGDVFGPGQDVTVTVDVTSVSDHEINDLDSAAVFNSLAQRRLGANMLLVADSEPASDDGVEPDHDGQITLDLPAGIYSIRTFHHRFGGDGNVEAEISVDDANGARVAVASQEATYEDLTFEIGTSPMISVNSNGTDPVVLTFTNIGSGGFPINGLVIDQIAVPIAASIPEPGAMWLFASGCWAATIRRWRIGVWQGG